MLKKVLKKKGSNKKLEKDGEEENKEDVTEQQIGVSLDSEISVVKKKSKKSKKVPPKKASDTLTKFFNDYSESPHLQAIEDSYLKFLEAAHAKESHLKQVKKFQILRALKKIQRFWTVKY